MADKGNDQQCEAVANLRVHMVRAHLEDIPRVALPEGFSMRPLRPGDAALWTDVVRDAEEFARIDDGLFSREFGEDWAEIGARCFFITNAKGVAVGTISAWYSPDFKGQEYGRIHWVAVRPAYQGQGLGKAALSYAMDRLAERHARCWLATSSARTPAIRMYLNFGFVPDLETPEDEAAWRHARAALDQTKA